MKLFTFQPPYVWEALQELGYWHPHHLHEYNPELREKVQNNWTMADAYDWLRQEMLNKGIAGVANDGHLVWAWQQYGTQVSVDRRTRLTKDFFREGDIGLELEIPKRRVCLTDYDLWHRPLNYHFLGNDEAEDAFFEEHREIETQHYPAESVTRLKDSWQKIFSLPGSLRLHGVPKGEQNVQATFFELFYTDVVRVVTPSEVRDIRHL